MYYSLPYPIAFGMCGAFAGLIGGGCNQCFPIWVGAATGGSLGCVISIFMMFAPEPVVEPVSSIAPDPVIVQNIYITYVSGQQKDIPVAKVVEPIN